MAINFGNGIVTGNIILRTSRSGGRIDDGIKTSVFVYPMWYATAKDWSGTNLYYTSGNSVLSSDYAGKYEIRASTELGNEDLWKLKNAFDRNFTNQWVGNMENYQDYITIRLVESNGNPRPLYIYMKGRHINNWSQTQIIVFFSSDGENWSGNKVLNMNFCGNLLGPSGAEYMWLSANYIIPQEYRNYNYIKLAGNGEGFDGNYVAFSEINLLFPRDITTVPEYTSTNILNGKPFISYPGTGDDLILNGSNIYGSSILNGSNAFYINLNNQSTIRIDAIIKCVTRANFTYKISMFIDSTVTDYVADPNNEIIKVDISGTFQNDGLQIFPQISWSGILSDGYHIITFSQLLDNTEKNNVNNVLEFNSSSEIYITCNIEN
jgi:hypothetical protein